MDVGNTRLKWRCVDAQGKVLARGVQGSGDAIAAIAREAAPRRVRVACVRDAMFERQLREHILQRWGVEAEFARSALQAAGVSTAYTQPAKLGVDRWLSLLAARTRGLGSCCIIDAGSALTVDLMRGDGQHLGGYIVPGLALQRASLLERTAIPQPGPAAWEGVGPGTSTATAIDHGILSMTVAWLSAVSEPVLRCGGVLYLTGGDALVISTQLTQGSVTHELVADLVLEGLAAALP